MWKIFFSTFFSMVSFLLCRAAMKPSLKKIAVFFGGGGAIVESVTRTHDFFFLHNAPNTSYIPGVTNSPFRTALRTL